MCDKPSAGDSLAHGLRVSLLLATVAALASCTDSTSPPAAIPAQTRLSIEHADRIKLASEQLVIPSASWGIYNLPDEHLTFLRRADGSYDLWASGDTRASCCSTIAFHGKNLFTLTPRQLAAGYALPALTPTKPGSQAPDADYSEGGTVLRAPDGKSLLMFYHGENHEFGNHHSNGEYYASVCLARSTDGGLTWKKFGAVINGMQPKPHTYPPPRFAMGAGGPTAIVVGRYVYVIYIDWEWGRFAEADSLHIARATLARDGSLGTWHKYYKGSFSQPGILGRSSAIIMPPAPSAKTQYAGFAHVSYNGKLRAFIAVYTTSAGFYYQTSQDLLTWTSAVALLPLPKTGVSYGYPTFLSSGESDDTKTGASGFLYYAKALGQFGATPRGLYRRAFMIRD